MFFTDEMPKNCLQCPCADGQYGICGLDSNIYTRSYDRPFDCPLQELKHARWIQKEPWKPLAWDSSPLDWDNYDEKTHSEKVFYWNCSNCEYERSRSVEPKDKYCPHCGAKMDEKE